MILTISLGLIFAWTTIVSAADMASTDISPVESIVIPGIDKSNTVQSTVERRMLIVSQADYIGTDKDLVGTIYDGRNMQTTMENASFNGSRVNVTLASDQSKSGMLDYIASVYAGADADDISYFFYTGHGYIQSEMASLVGVDGTYLSTKALKAALDKVPGTKVLILDCCRSGGFISSSGSAIAAEGRENFSQNFIDAFTKDAAGKTISGKKYKILAACSSSQYSYEGTIPGSPDPSNGYFTYWFCNGAGGPPGGNGILSADTDSDSNVSLQEMYSYTYENVKEMVAAEDGIDDVQVYPANDSSFDVFSRTSGDAGAGYIQIVRNDIGGNITAYGIVEMEPREKISYSITEYDENGKILKNPKLKFYSSARRICIATKSRLSAGTAEGIANITVSDKATGASISFIVDVSTTGSGDVNTAQDRK